MCFFFDYIQLFNPIDPNALLETSVKFAPVPSPFDCEVTVITPFAPSVCSEEAFEVATAPVVFAVPVDAITKIYVSIKLFRVIE